MKRAHRIMTVLLAVLVFATASVPAFAKNEAQGHTIDHYEYPVLPGTEEWEQHETFMQRLALCRIPQETLDKMTSEALADAVLDFPFLINALVYDDFGIGFKNLVNQCDALRELLARPEGPNLLAEKYVYITMRLGTRGEKAPGMEKYCVYPLLLEPILGQPEVYNTMDYVHRYLIEKEAKRYNEGLYSFLDWAIDRADDQIERAQDIPYTPRGNAVPYYD